MTLESALDRVGELIAATAREHHCPTISWAVAIDGHVVAAEAHGRLADRRSPSRHTVYRIASMTKSFTAATVLALRDEGLLTLDDHLTELAPELASVVGPTTDAAPITVRHLLSMAAGMASDDAWADRHLDIDAATLEALLVAGAAFAVDTGTAFEYSNLGYAMLGRIVDRLTGTRVQRHVTDRFLRPLGMDRTTWTRPDHDDWAPPHEVVGGLAEPDRHEPLADGEIAPMGGLWSTTADLCRWMTWLDEATPARDGDDGGPLCRASRREMQQIQRYSCVKLIAGRPAPTGYGFGLMVRDDDVHGRIVGHSGGLPGYGSNMRWIAGRRIGVVALANVKYAPMGELTLRMLDVLGDHEALPPVAERPGRQSLADLKRFAQLLVDLLAGWTDEAADVLFADNVALDEPYASRAAAAAELVERMGAIAIDRVVASTSTSASVTLDNGAGATATVSFDLTPLLPLRIQSYLIGEEAG